MMIGIVFIIIGIIYMAVWPIVDSVFAWMLARVWVEESEEVDRAS